MDTETRLTRSLLNIPGIIHRIDGTEFRVTFSLYKHEDLGSNTSAEELADGSCRVSDGSPVLEDLFASGIAVTLMSDQLEATIHLTSPCAFEVTGRVIKKRQDH